LVTLEECFGKGLLRRVDPSGGKARESLRQARTWLAEAEQAFAAGVLRSALLAVYNGCFHAARAVLFRDGLREKSHYCIELYLDSYVREGHLEAGWIAVFGRMRSARHTDLYSFQPAPSREEVESAIRDGGKFVDRMELLLENTGPRG
jgi:uncharacterized protein (UPF0332 family)